MVEIDPSFLTAKEFIAGWLGGVGGLLTSHPIDTIKVRHQDGGGKISQAILTTYKYEGLHGFYKGIGFPALMAGIQNAIFFGVYANVHRFLKEIPGGQNPDTEMLRIMIAGNCAGMVQVVCTNPVEIVKIRLQTRTGVVLPGVWHNPHDTISKNIAHIYKSHGFFGFYHGFLATALRDIPTGGLYIAMYIKSDAFLSQYIGSYWSHLISGGLAGALSYAPVTPVDVIKTRLQADHAADPKYRGFVDCVRKSYKENGFASLWRGFTPSFLRSFIGNGTIFFVYELVLQALT